MSNCVVYNGKTYEKGVLFDKIKSKPEFFANKHDIANGDLDKLEIREMPKSDLNNAINSLKNGSSTTDIINDLKKSDYYNSLNDYEKSLLTKETILDELKRQVSIAPKQQTEHARKKTLISERIKAEQRTPKNPIRKVFDIASDIAKALEVTMINARGKSSRTLGSYNPSNALIKIKNANDIDTIAHELGHALDDRFDILDGVLSNELRKELKWLYDRGGSNPPSSLKGAERSLYLKREGLAEFVRAYVLNPNEVKNIAPNLHTLFENKVSAKTIEALQKFSEDAIDLMNASNSDKIISNIVEDNPHNKTLIQKVKDYFKNDPIFGNHIWGKFNTNFVDAMTMSNRAFTWINKQSGIDLSLNPGKDFRVLAKLFNGVDAKIDNILKNGLVDGNNRRFRDAVTGEPLTVKWLFDNFDTTTKETLLQDKKETTLLLIAERTVEYAKKHGREDALTGISQDGETDLEVAQNYLKEFEDLKNTNPEKYNRIKEGARRYRAYSDAVLMYSVDMGRLSKEDYQKIKDNNEYYVNLSREKTIDYASDSNLNDNFLGGKPDLTSVRQVLKRSKGSTDAIKDPFESMLMTTAALIKEADRNHVMNAFVRAMDNVRDIGDGTPIDFAQIGTRVEPIIKKELINGEEVWVKTPPKDKNITAIYNDGKVEYWRFSEDMQDALDHLNGIVFLNLHKAKVIGDIIRWTVTKFPIFAMRNYVRDTVARAINSRSVQVTTKGISGLKQDYTKEEQSQWELYGGGFGGYYADSDAYKKQLGDAMIELTHSGGLLFSGKKAIDKYQKLLEKSENVNRMAEYKIAYKQAIEKGMDEYNAGLYAAYQSRDLLDFAVGGKYIKALNNLIPFLNAGVQGVSRGIKGAYENPTQFLIKTTIFTVLPTIIMKGLVHAMGDDDDYDELSPWQRDFFWNFKIPIYDGWISIPKPFENGMIASLTDRMIDYGRGRNNAMDGYSGSLLKSLVPVDESSWLGFIKPIVEIVENRDSFRDTNIIPTWDVDRIRGERESDKNASRIGKLVSDAIFTISSADINPNNIDHFIKGYGTYFGKTALQLSNIGREDGEDAENRFSVDSFGFSRKVSVSSAVSVQRMSDLAKELGMPYGKDMRFVRDLKKAYYSTDEIEKKKKIRNAIYKFSKSKADEYEVIRDVKLEYPSLHKQLAEDFKAKKISPNELKQKIKSLDKFDEKEKKIFTAILVEEIFKD